MPLGSLYRKLKTPGGRIRYEEVYQWDSGDPTEGIWIVKRLHSGPSWKWITEKIEDLPNPGLRFSLENLRDEVCHEVHKKFEGKSWSLDGIVTAVFEAICSKKFL